MQAMQAVFASILLIATFAAQSAEPITPPYVETPEPGHVEVALGGSKGASLQTDAIASISDLVQQQGFLASLSTASQSPVTPCALLSAAFVSDLLNRMFAGFINPGTITFFPPPGTNILGAYDSDMRQGKGSVPRENPNRAANIVSRLVVWQSWRFSAILNTLITPLSQGDCLRMLVSPSELDAALKALNPATPVLTHAAPAAAYVSSFGSEQGNRYLAQLTDPLFLDLPRSAVTNPLSPCSVLTSFRLAARLNHAWNYQIAKGKFETDRRVELAPYAEELQSGSALQSVSTRTAELIAAVFIAEISRANHLSSQLTQDATQRQCLDEIFTPGGLRLRLLEKGITVPLK